jgi:hypothetical protein
MTKSGIIREKPGKKFTAPQCEIRVIGSGSAGFEVLGDPVF